MPLDTGAVTQGVSLSVGADRDEGLSTQPPSLDSAGTLGAILRAVREFHGLDLEDLSQATRIRRNYLASLEDMKLELLPSRPFTIGYVRAYAAALGLDPEAAVARFKLDAPDEDEPLRPPVGVRREGDPRLVLIAAGGAIVAAGVLLWNVAQRAVVNEAPARPVTADVAAAASVKVASAAHGPAVGPVALGAPLPVPPESTTPKPYVTPGLEPAASDASASDASLSASDIADASDAPVPVFTARGAVYGGPADPSAIILQAKRAALVVIHGADGAVYFARQLAAGEAYRAPAAKGLTVDVSDPQAFDVFVAGVFKGPLPAAQMPLSKLIG
jgi:cytoskeleton protein RodZ